MLFHIPDNGFGETAGAAKAPNRAFWSPRKAILDLPNRIKIDFAIQPFEFEEECHIFILCKQVGLPREGTARVLVHNKAAIK
jgi:hypothetical protein